MITTRAKPDVMLATASRVVLVAHPAGDDAITSSVSLRPNA